MESNFPNKFPCTSCGCCCRRVDKAVEATREIAVLAFPYEWDQTGKCEMLGDDNKCTVYEERPLLCNIDKILELLQVDKQSFYEENIKSCNAMMDMDAIAENFRIKIADHA